MRYFKTIFGDRLGATFEASKSYFSKRNRGSFNVALYRRIQELRELNRNEIN